MMFQRALFAPYSAPFLWDDKQKLVKIFLSLEKKREEALYDLNCLRKEHQLLMRVARKKKNYLEFYSNWFQMEKYRRTVLDHWAYQYYNEEIDKIEPKIHNIMQKELIVYDIYETGVMVKGV